jgi:hypothetical protein
VNSSCRQPRRVVRRYFGEEQPATDVDAWFPTGDLARIALAAQKN